MALFTWDERFLTGEASVDHEHRGLVDLINRVAALQTEDDNGASAAQILDELVEYAAVHFQHEEALMASTGCDPRHTQAHAGVHQHFARQVSQMRQTGAGEADLEYLLRFLSSWLAYHILGMDQAMTRQIRHIRTGMSAAEAYEAEKKVATDPATSSLLAAMHSLYGVVAQRNQQLMDFNEQLESQVQERTAELAAANQSLISRNRDLQSLNAKLEEAHQQLLQAEKLAALGQLAAGVAHEINNPISFVRSNIHTLNDYLQDLLRIVDPSEATPPDIDVAFLREDIPVLMHESLEGIERVKKIVQHLRDFSQLDRAQAWGWGNLRTCLDSTLQLLASRLNDGPAGKIALRREDGDTPEIWCCLPLLNLVLAGLLINAIEAVPPGQGEIHLRSGSSGEEVWLEIADNGRGIAPELLPKIFDPFFTTKPVGTGTGMGLAQAWGIIRQHHGRIDVSSTPGRGSSFRVVLPRRQPGQAG